MRIAVAAALLFVLAIPAPAQQPTPESLQQLNEELRRLVTSLQEVQADLRDARREIRELRNELGQFRATAQPQPPPAGAEESSLSSRVAELEESQRIADSRLQQHEQTKVESASKYNVRLSGMILFNAGMNRGFVNNQDVPTLAVPGQPGVSAGDISGSMRQSRIGLQIFGPRLAGAKTTADIQFDFFGGGTDIRDGAVLGLLRLRTARATLDWDRWSLSFGQDQPFISPLSPTSLASLGTPAFGYSGNLWTWTPQIVATRRWRPSERDTFELQFGVLDPFNGEPPRGFQLEREPGAGERSRVPAFAIHPVWRRGQGERAMRIGAGAYFAKQDYGFNRTVDAWAATVDWDIPLGSIFSVSGELFRGRALGGLWGGIGQSVVYNGPPEWASTATRGLNTVGGWSQLKVRPTATWEFNGAFGQDNPFASDIRTAPDTPGPSYPYIMRNWTTLVNVIQRPRSNLLWSLEYRHLNTVHFDGSRRTAEHVNMAVGLQF